MNEPEVMREMLGGPERRPRTLAVVGLSDDPSRPSHMVSAFMQQRGYRILPVNPEIDSVLGEPSYPSLAGLPLRPDVVNIFRLPKFLSAIVDEMIELGLKDMWAQLGIEDKAAATKAEEHGIRVVMNRCVLIEYKRQFGN